MDTECKRHLLKQANEKLHICDDLSSEKNRNLIFVYCPPKVGSTTLVTSFRMSVLHKYTILHIHDEEMINVLCGITQVTINEIILYNRSLGKNVYVIDIYRSPIEHKISMFFEKVASFHYNNTEDNVNKYDIDKVIKRFNNLFPHLTRLDYYKEVYNIECPLSFDHEKKYLLVNDNGIIYIKLRLKDSSIWHKILKEIFHTNIVIVNDYETDKKPIKTLYNRFKQQYKIPINFLQDIEICPSLQFYYSSKERTEYLNAWSNKQTENYVAYTLQEYSIYMDITFDNHHIGEIQRTHYIDVGCACKSCGLKRIQILNNLSKGEQNITPIDHNTAVVDYNNLVNLQKIQKFKTLMDKLNTLNNKNKQNLKKTPSTVVKGIFNKIV
jgi:hypothetical protein